MAQEVGEDKRVIEIRVLLLPRMCMKHSPPHSLALTLSSHRLPCSPALILTLTQRVPLRLQRQQPARVAGESRLAGRYTRCHSSSPAPDTTHAGTDGESAGALAHVPCLLSLSRLFFAATTALLFSRCAPTHVGSKRRKKKDDGEQTSGRHADTHTLCSWNALLLLHLPYVVLPSSLRLSMRAPFM